MLMNVVRRNLTKSNNFKLLVTSSGKLYKKLNYIYMLLFSPFIQI